MSGGSGEICWRCSTYVEAGNRFCTRCGADLEAAPSVEVKPALTGPEAATTAPERPVAAAADPRPGPEMGGRQVERPGSSGRRWRWAASAAVLALAVLAILFGLSWQSEAAKQRSTAKALHATQSQYATLESAYKTLRQELQTTTSLSNRRAGVLRQTAKVLRRVEPLLSSVDRLQSLTADIQQERDAFTTSSGALVDDLITLGNYLIHTPADLIDVSYASSLIGGINSEISTTNNELDSLTAYDNRYSDASTVFSQKATPFSSSVRELQRQLRAVARS